MKASTCIVVLACLVCVATAAAPARIVQNVHENDAHITPELLEVEAGAAPTKGCDKCEIEDNYDMHVRNALSKEDMQRWQTGTKERVSNILNMVDGFLSKPSPRDQRTEHNIHEAEELLNMYGQLKTKLSALAAREGVQVRLPSDFKTYTDAMGNHWEDAHMKTDLDVLNDEWHKETDKDKKDLKDFETGEGTPQWEEGPGGKANRLINDANPIRPKIVKSLTNSPNPCPCSCASTTCPCMCQKGDDKPEPAVSIGPLSDDREERQLERET